MANENVVPEPRTWLGQSGRLCRSVPLGTIDCFAFDAVCRSPGHRVGHPSANVPQMSSLRSHQGRMNQCRNSSPFALQITQSLVPETHHTEVRFGNSTTPWPTSPSRLRVPRQNAEPTPIMPKAWPIRNVGFRPPTTGGRLVLQVNLLGRVLLLRCRFNQRSLATSDLIKVF